MVLLGVLLLYRVERVLNFGKVCAWDWREIFFTISAPLLMIVWADYLFLCAASLLFLKG